MTRARARIGAVALLLAVGAAACGGDAPAGPPPGAARLVESGAKRTRTTKPPEAPATRVAPAVLEVAMTDQDDRPRAGVEIRYEGRDGTEGTLRTDARGIARKTLPPGTYRLGVPGRCQDRYVLEGSSGGGTVGLPAGGRVRVPVNARLQRRYAPATPVQWSPEPPWARGRTVVFRFSLVDRCTDRLAPDETFGEYRYRPASNLRVIDSTPQRSDGEATATVRFECTAAGDAQLRLEDPQNPRDGTDLLDLRPPFTPGTDWCG